MITRKFKLYRKRDKTGISGTGLVAEGVQFFNDKVALTWTSSVKTMEVMDSWKDFLTIHIHNHNNNSTIVWEDGEEENYE